MTWRAVIMALVAALLASLVYLDQTRVAEVAAVPEASKPVAVAALNPVAALAPDALKDLTAHPLFAPSRAAAEVAPAEAPLAPTLEVVPPPDVADAPVEPVLMGTVTSPGPGGVFLGDSAGGPVVFLRPGQKAMGLALVAVGEKSARFMGPDGEVTLSLQLAAGAP
jgi:hypothetical protein